MNTRNGYSQYKINSVTYASKQQLLLMLLDGAVKFSKIGRQAIADKDIKKAHENIKKTQDIFYELISTLDMQNAGEWGSQMISIYTFIINSLVQANLKKDVKEMDDIIPLIESVKETWNDAYKMSTGKNVVEGRNV